MEWSRLIAYSPRLQTATWRLSIGSPIFWQINVRKNSCCTKLLNSRLENKASRKYDGQNARNLLFRKQISTGCRPISDLRSETKRLNQGQSKENPWSGLVKDMITGQRPYRAQLPLLFHCICHWCNMLFYVELHIFSLFAASVYILIEIRGNVRLHNFWSHLHDLNVLAVTYFENTSFIFISPTIEKA